MVHSFNWIVKILSSLGFIIVLHNMKVCIKESSFYTDITSFQMDARYKEQQAA